MPSTSEPSWVPMVPQTMTDRSAKLEKASHIAGRISDFQHGLGAAAACAWSKAQFANSVLTKAGSEATV